MVSGEDLWEDLSDSDASEVKVSSKPPKISVKNKQKQHYSAVIQRRINALKVLQLQNKVMETKVPNNTSNKRLGGRGRWEALLKYGFLKKSFIMNALLLVEHLLITFWWVQHSKPTKK